MTDHNDIPEGPIRILGKGYWAEDIAWWAAAAVVWPLWLAVWLIAAALVYVAASDVLGLMGAASYAEVVVASAVAVLAAAAACIYLSVRLSRWLTWRDMPGRLWLVPALWGVGLLVAFLITGAVSFFQGVPGPLPWSRETTVGFFFMAGFAVVPLGAAWGFKRASQRTAARRDRARPGVPAPDASSAG